ncbi:MAG: phosphoribosyltransferase family protein [Pseudomonadota bacterium]
MTRSERWGDLWPAGAECVLSAETVSSAMDAQAERLMDRLEGHDDVTLMVLMNGGMWPALELARRLDRPFRLDHVKASRYREALEGADIQWGHWPERVTGTIVLIDDIFDEGHTMEAVSKRLQRAGAESVITVAMALKAHERGLPRAHVDDAAFEVPDRYVFGCGMDWKGLWRQLDAVWALGEE